MMRDILEEVQKSHVLATKHVWCMTMGITISYTYPYPGGTHTHTHAVPYVSLTLAYPPGKYFLLFLLFFYNVDYLMSNRVVMAHFAMQLF